jgi:hypothetical protein
MRERRQPGSDDFARDLSEPLTRLVLKIDAAAAAHRDREMGAFAVFLTEKEDLRC